MVELHVQTHIAAPIERCFDLARSIELHLLGTQATGEQAIGGVTSGLIGEGQSVRWRAKHFGIWQQLESRITAYDRPAFFQDTMVKGAFRFMQHDHIFQRVDADHTLMEDRFVFAAPVPFFGRLAEELVLKRYMKRFLQQRNAILKQAAESDQWKSLLLVSQ
ncbi:MAG TPA: SRPBCC family protein [Terriglobus sp.]